MTGGAVPPAGAAGGGPDPDGFGDTGAFPAEPTGTADARGVHWPTVLAAGGVAAIVAAVIVTIGVIGMHRADRGEVSAQPVMVTVDAPAARPAATDETDDRPGEDDTDDADAESAADIAPEEGALAPAQGATAQGAPAPADADAEPAPAAQPEPESESESDPAAQEPSGAWTPAAPLPADFTVTADEPTVAQLNDLVYFLVATSAADEAKARNLEGGQGAVVVPQTVYRVGFFRAPRGGSRVSGPLERDGERITARLHASSAGIPDVAMPIVFVRRDGNWRLSSDSLCQGVRTLGLPIFCNA